jgi:hypothetical protein
MTPEPAAPPIWYLDGSALRHLPGDQRSVAALVAAVAEGRLQVVTSPEALLECAGPLALAPAGVTRILDALAATLLPPRQGRATLLRSLDPIAAGDQPELQVVPPTPFPLGPELAGTLADLVQVARTLTTDLEARLRANPALGKQVRSGQVQREGLAAALFDSAVGDRERLRTLALLLLDALGGDAEPRLLEAAEGSPALRVLLAIELDRIAEELTAREAMETGPRVALRLHHAVTASTHAALVTADPDLRRVCSMAWPAGIPAVVAAGELAARLA